MMNNSQIGNMQLVLQLWNTAKSEENNLADKAISGANKTEADFRNLQFVLATFLFTFSSPILTQRTLTDNNVRLLVFLAWIFLFSSIIAGIIHMAGVIKFFLQRADFHYKKVKLYSMIGTIEEYENTVKNTNSLNEDGIPKSPLIPLVLQSMLLLIGFILMVSSATIMLFK